MHKFSIYSIYNALKSHFAIAGKYSWMQTSSCNSNTWTALPSTTSEGRDWDTPSQVAEPSEKKQAAVIEPVSCHSNSSTRLPQVTSVAAGEQTSDGSQYVVVPVLVPADSQLATMFSASSISINAPSSSQPTPKKGYPEPYRCQCFNDRQIIKVKDTATQTDGGIHQSTLNSGAVCDEESMFSVHVQTGRNLELTELLDLSTQTELQNDLLDFGTQTLLNYSEQGSQTNILNDFILTNAFGTQTD